MSIDLDSSLGIFVDEAQDLLGAMENALLSTDPEQFSSDDINAMFRAAHTIKGSAGLFGLNSIVAFTHVVENVLDRVRDKRLEMDAALVELMLQCRDHIKHLVESAGQRQEPSGELIGQGESLLQRLQKYAQVQKQHDVQESTLVIAERGCWHLSLRFGPDVLRNGMDPLSFIRYLATLGEIQQLSVVDDGLPAWPDFDAETSYLGFELDLNTDAPRERIESVFEFVREDSQIRLLPPNSKIDEYVKLIQSLPESDARIGELLVKSGVITDAELQRALKAQQRGDGDKRIGDILGEREGTPKAVINAAVEKQKLPDEKRAQAEARFVKTDATRLDKLVNLIGELVISNASATVIANATQQAAVIEANEHLSNLIEQIRDTALTLRMVPIGETFQRFRRVVRDVAKELNKSIELVIEGGDTEMDRTMVEKLNDPLTHIVRNAIDHGIESIDRRRYVGKPESGTLILNAFHEGGNIVIEINDDGGGLNREKILAKAIEKGLVKESEQLTESEIDQLIFAPGFSTADKVTNLSGRGVGMDVVKRNIDELRGSIEIQSTPGTGTRMRIRLPLTLAIIDGFHVAAAGANFVLPLSQVVECLDWRDVTGSAKHQDCIELRGEVLPILRLRDVFELDGDDAKREKIVVVEFADRRAGVVVDELMGELQTVIKPMGQIFRSLRGIGGSTILGTGDVALIIDVAQLIECVVQRESKRIRRKPSRVVKRTKQD